MKKKRVGETKGVEKSDEVEKRSASLFDLILIPSMIMIISTLLVSLFQKWISSTPLQVQMGISVLGLLIQVGCFVYIGFKLTKIKIKKSSISFFAGFVSGAIVSFVGAVVGIISIYFFPSVYDVTVDLLLEQGFSREIALYSLQFASWLNLFLGPIVLGLVGAIISWVSFLIFKERR